MKQHRPRWRSFVRSFKTMSAIVDSVKSIKAEIKTRAEKSKASSSPAKPAKKSNLKKRVEEVKVEEGLNADTAFAI